MNYMIYKTPHFGGPGPKGRVGLAWRDVMAGKSIRPDQDADNGRVLGNVTGANEARRAERAKR